MVALLENPVICEIKKLLKCFSWTRLRGFAFGRCMYSLVRRQRSSLATHGWGYFGEYSSFNSIRSANRTDVNRFYIIDRYEFHRLAHR